jgi:hypothetical protein
MKKALIYSSYHSDRPIYEIRKSDLSQSLRTEIHEVVFSLKKLESFIDENGYLVTDRDVGLVLNVIEK